MFPIDFVWIEQEGMSAVTALCFTFCGLMWTGFTWWVLREINRIDTSLIENKDYIQSVDKSLDSLRVDMALCTQGIENINDKMGLMAEAMKDFNNKK